MPQFEAFRETHCLKLGKCVTWFSSNHGDIIRSRSLKRHQTLNVMSRDSVEPFVLSPKFMHRQTDWAGALSWSKKQSPRIPLFTQFSPTIFPKTPESCQFSYADLQFVRVEHIQMHKSVNVKKRGGETFSAHLRELVLAFGGGGDGGKMITLFQCNYFTDRDSYFRGQVPSRDPHFHLFCLWCMPTASELGKQLKTCGLPIIYPSKATFKHLKSCCSSTYFPALKQNLIQRRCSFKSVIFYIRQNRKQNTYALKKTLLNNHTCNILIPSRKWLSRLYSIYI